VYVCLYVCVKVFRKFFFLIPYKLCLIHFLSLLIMYFIVTCLNVFNYSCYSVLTVCPKKVPPPLNVWIWQVQTCTTLHIINHAQALMNLEYCHQILYKSIVPFSRLYIFTKWCQKVELPAALLTCFLCALTVFCVNVQHFSSFGVHWNFIFWAYQALIFIDRLWR